MGEKNYREGIQKGGKMPNFSPIGKKYAYFFPIIDLKYTKLKKNGWQIFDNNGWSRILISVLKSLLSLVYVLNTLDVCIEFQIITPMW